MASLCEEIAKYIDAGSVAKATIPSGIILTFSTIGADLGGPLGFGAGGVVGNLFIGTAKPDELSKKVEEAFSSKDD